MKWIANAAIGQDGRPDGWACTNEFVQRKLIVGRPQSTHRRTVEELEALGLVGIYVPDKLDKVKEVLLRKEYVGYVVGIVAMIIVYEISDILGGVLACLFGLVGLELTRRFCH